MHNNSNLWNKQMKINTCKIVPLLKISRIHAWKMTPFLDFANSRLPLKKYAFFRENEYERGICFVRERRGREINLAYI